MNFFKAHTTFALFFFIFALFSASFATTQNVYAQEVLENCGSPLCVKITNQSFDESTRTASVSVDVWNNTQTFVDNISYALSLYEGEALATSGNIFSAVDFVSANQGSLESMYMGELVSETITFQIPETFPTSNYFTRLTVSNENKSLYGITYFKEPLVVTGGKGTFIPPLNAALLDTESNQLFGLYEGPTLATTARPTLVLLETVNPELFAMLETEEIFLTITSDMNSPGQAEKLPLGLYLKREGAAIEVPLAFDEVMAGSHAVTLSFTDFYNNEVVPSLTAQILYEGLIGTIFDVKTEINAYRKGEPLDLRVNVLTGGDPTVDAVVLDVVLRGDKEFEQTISRQLSLQQQFEGEDFWILFDDEKIDKRTNVTSVEVTLKKTDGTLLDSRTVYLDDEKEFMYPSNVLTNIFILVIVLIVVLLVIYVLKKKKIIPAKIGLFLILGITGLASVGAVAHMVYADASVGAEGAGFEFLRYDEYDDGNGYYYYQSREINCIMSENSNDWSGGDSSNEFCIPLTDGPLMSIWSNPSSSPSGNPDDLACSGQCQDVEYYVKVQCKKCDNAPVDTYIDFYSLWEGVVPQTYVVSNAVDEAYILSYGESTVEAALNETYADAYYGEESDYSNYAGYTSSDTVNYWIYGPFLNETCFLDTADYFYEDTDINLYSPSGVSADGSKINHYYQITALTNFGGDYCQVGFVYERDYNFGGTPELQSKVLTLNDRRLLTCNLDNQSREFHVSVFLDANEDGLYDEGEVFIKNEDAAASCVGTVDETLEVGISRYSETTQQFSSGTNPLDSSTASLVNCSYLTEYEPYAVFSGYTDPDNERYQPIINTNTYEITGFSAYDKATETWVDETVAGSVSGGYWNSDYSDWNNQFFIDQEPYQNGPVKVRVGVTNEYPVFISCQPGSVTDLDVDEDGELDEPEDSEEPEEPYGTLGWYGSSHSDPQRPDESCTSAPSMTIVPFVSEPGECTEDVSCDEEGQAEVEELPSYQVYGVTVHITDTCWPEANWVGHIFAKEEGKKERHVGIFSGPHGTSQDVGESKNYQESVTFRLSAIKNASDTYQGPLGPLDDPGSQKSNYDTEITVGNPNGFCPCPTCGDPEYEEQHEGECPDEEGPYDECFPGYYDAAIDDCVYD